MIDWNLFPRFGRERELKSVLELLVDRFPVPNIVEIGTAYRYDLAELGNAVLAFATLAQLTGGRVDSFDPTPSSVSSAREILRQYAPGAASRVTFHERSGEAAGDLSHPIHLLYQDGPMEDNHNTARVENRGNVLYTRIYRATQHLLPSGALVLFDDTGPDFSGKGVDAIPTMLRDGWRIVDLGSPSMVLLELP